MNTTFNNRVRDLRLALNLTQSDLAKLLGDLSRHTIGHIEFGRRKPSFEVLSALIEKTHVDPRWLFWGEGEMFYFPKEE